MPFPTIPTEAAGRVLFQLNTNPAGTHTSDDLTGLTKSAGDLLIAIIIIYDGNSTNAEFSGWTAGWTEFADFSTTTTMAIGCAYKWSTGAETGTISVTSADTSANDSCFILLSIPGAHAGTPPEAGSFVTDTAAAANPGAFNPAGWDAEDTLWIAVGASGEVSTSGAYTGIASGPANYTDYAESGMSADAAGAVEGAVAFRQLNVASDDVGTFSVDLSAARNAACVIAVRPAWTPRIISYLDAKPTYEAAVRADTPVSWWRFRETSGTNAEDMMGTNAGTYAGSPTLNQDGPAYIGGKSILLSGTEYVSVADHASLDTGDVVSTEIWFKTSNTANYKLLISRGDDSPGTNRGYSSYLMAASPFGAVRTDKDTIQKLCDTTISGLDDNQWHHFVFTKNGATVKVYVDGVDRTGTVVHAILNDVSVPLGIGAIYRSGAWDANYRFIGYLAEPAIYNYALSADRVLAHYNAAYTA